MSKISACLNVKTSIFSKQIVKNSEDDIAKIYMPVQQFYMPWVVR